MGRGKAEKKLHVPCCQKASNTSDENNAGRYNLEHAPTNETALNGLKHQRHPAYVIHSFLPRVLRCSGLSIRTAYEQTNNDHEFCVDDRNASKFVNFFLYNLDNFIDENTTPNAYQFRLQRHFLS